MHVATIIILFSGLFVQIFATYNPFTIEHRNKTFKSEYSDTNRITLITLNSKANSTVSLKMCGKEIGKYPAPGTDDTMIVMIYPSSQNPQFVETKRNVIMTSLCEFSYPITVTAGSDSYKCSLTYKDKFGLQHSIGNCQLTLQYKSSLCLVSGIIDPDNLRNKSHVIVTATVYYCTSRCNTDKDWSQQVNTSLTLPFIGWHHLVWLTTFLNATGKLGILIGVPKNPINKSTNFEIPVKLKANQHNNDISELQLRVFYNAEISIDEVTFVGCFKKDQVDSYSDNNSPVTIVKMKRGDTGQCSKGHSDVLFTMQMSSNENAKDLKIEITVDNILFENDIPAHTFSQKNNTERKWITIPLFQGRHAIIPLFNNPIILPSVDKPNSPFQLNPSHLKIYYVYEETQFTDVSTTVQCRPFDSSRLKCPSNMLSLSPVLTSPDDRDALQWSLELMVNGLFLVFKAEPLLMADDEWMVIFQDSVLNQISGWNGIRRSRDSPLIRDDKCEPVYQVTEIQIFKKMLLYNSETGGTMETVMDLSDSIDYRNIRISKGSAHVYKRGKSMIVQGIVYGNLILDLVTIDNKTLRTSSMTVYDEAVSVIDMDISCISDINITNKVMLSSSLLFASDILVQFQNLNGSQDCAFIIHLIFSDKSRINIASFPSDQYSLKFVTNRKIIEINNPHCMWYNRAEFDDETSFYVELHESKYCNNPRTIFRKKVFLNILTTKSPIVTNRTTNNNAKNSTVSKMLLSTTTMETIFGTNNTVISRSSGVGIAYLSASIVLLALIIILVYILFWFYKKKKFRAYNSIRRKSLNGTNLNNLLAENNDRPPLLPPPGPQVQLTDPSNVTISSPHSFWCLDSRKSKRSTAPNPFVRQTSLPVKGCSSRIHNEKPPCPPLRWANKMMPPCPIKGPFNSQDALNSTETQDLLSCSPMTWSVTHLDIEESSGVGSLNTNMDDMIKDPYGSQERFNKLSELPYLHSNHRNDFYNFV